MSRLAATAGPLTLAAGVVAVYLLRLDTAAGLIVDDAWYAVLAKALAQGDGFRLISSAVTPIMPAVPPGYPLILAPLFLASPSFPANVPLLKSVSIAAMIGVGVVTYRYLVEHRGMRKSMAAAIAVATVLTPALVFLATSTLMSECVFTLAQVLTVSWLERVVRAEDPPLKQRRAVAAGALAAAAMLIRTAGAATLLAGLVFLLKERAYRPAAAFALTAALCLAPWTLYSISHAPTAAQVDEHGGTIAYAYSDWFGMARPGDPGLGTVRFADLGARLGRNLVNVFGRDIGGVIVPSLFRGAAESGEEVVSLGGMTGFIASSMGGNPITVAITFALTGIVVIGFIAVLRRRVTAAEILMVLSLAVVVSVPARTFRYVLPLTPYFLFYFASGVEVISRGLSSLAGAVSTDGLAARIVMLCVLGLQVQDHSQYIVMKLRGPIPPDWLGDAQAVNGLTDWMNANLDGTGAVATTNPGLVYLLTGRHTVATDDYSRSWARWRTAGVRYLVALRPLALPPRSLNYRLVYLSPRRSYWVIEMLSP